MVGFTLVEKVHHICSYEVFKQHLSIHANANLSAANYTYSSCFDQRNNKGGQASYTPGYNN